MQVVLGALTTGLSVILEGKQIATMTAILGGIATLVASYVARVRGSSEPEKSLLRSQELTQYIRELEVYIMDYGSMGGDGDEGKGEEGKWDEGVKGWRERLQEILGDGNGNGNGNGNNKPTGRGKEKTAEKKETEKEKDDDD